MKKITLMDAFAGIGGFHYGVENACEQLGLEFECVAAIEFDASAREVYYRNFPSTPIYNDITKLDVAKLPDHNLLTAGFPCQPFSLAGLAHTQNNNVVTDVRGELYRYLIEILLVKKPDRFIFENVENILRSKNSDGRLVVDLIREDIEAAGYGLQIVEISPHQVGVPQSRKRVWFIGARRPNMLQIVTTPNRSDQVIAYICESGVSEKYYLPSGSPLHIPIRNMDKVSTTSTLLVSDNTGNWQGCARQADRVYSPSGICPTITTGTPPKILDNTGRARKLTETECARLQGFPDNWGGKYKHYGNAVCTKVVTEIAYQMLLCGSGIAA
jgi:DNA (cytosine-5)-methyltransferase 1